MRILFATLLAFVALPALAHPGHDGNLAGFAAGFAHPFSGLDHLLAMLAVGVWSATTSRRIWLAPLFFAGTLLIGALLAANGIVLPGVEPMVAASVLLLGLLVMARVRLPDIASAALVAVFALFHGAAHGNELGLGDALVGMVLATASLHSLGLLMGMAIETRGHGWQRSIGAGIALSGIGFAFNLL